MIFAIGDIHGCADELRLLLNKLALASDTRVVFIGDYVDRGPDSKGVIDTILELREACPVITLMGNHEAMFLDYLEDPYSARAGAFIYNGGSATLASYADDTAEVTIPPEHIEFLRELRLCYETEHNFFVHAGIPDVPIRELDVARDGPSMLWIRRKFLRSEYQWSKVVVHGHTPVHTVTLKPNRINIDTGCVFRRRLSAVALPGERIFSVPHQLRPRKTVLRDIRSQRAASRFVGSVPVRVRHNGEVHEFSTIDYSELGMYMRDLTERDTWLLDAGDKISGVIGPDPHSAIEFYGRVVRRHRDDRGAHYGVRILSTGPAAPG